jgi:DNA repair protein RAD5
MFRDQKQYLPKAARAATEDSTFHPLPALLKVIGLSPFKKVSGLILLYLFLILFYF